MIRPTKVTADKNPNYSTDPGKNTTDKVFLLSIIEAEKYFTLDNDRMCVPTAGSKWNDVPDRNQMSDKKAFGTCFSWATTENVALWMLYSGNRGENGAMIDFPASILKGVVQIQEAEIGFFGR